MTDFGFIDLVLLFFIYAFAGWCIEVTLKYIQFRRFINRGFLTGPICPIYGTGAVLITLAIRLLTPLEKAVGTTFAVSFVLCGAVEYVTSWVMEKRFHARWWDYSQKPMNLHGRIWIGNLLLFGLGGVGIVHVFNPLLAELLALPSPAVKRTAALIMGAVALADCAMTHVILKLVKTGVENSTADNTEEIGREVRLLLSDRSVFHRRFADAYPEVIYRTDRVRKRIAAIRAETERLRKEAEMLVEPTSRIKTGLIEKQDRLIAMLYDERLADQDAKELKAAIDAERERLGRRPVQRIGNTIRSLK